MKKLFLIAVLFPILAFGQIENNFETPPSFIENKGQFNGRNWQSNQIEYAIDYDDSYVFFTNKGLTYRFDKIVRNPDRDKKHPDSPKRINISELVHVTWVNPNENVEILVQDEVSGYYSYVIRDFVNGGVKNENQINGYKKLIYKNLYDNIDVEYVFNPEGGFKYSFILHPGADILNIKMKYRFETTNVGGEFVNIGLDESGNVKINSSQAEIIEHKPFTFYKDNDQEISTWFQFENNILSFGSDGFDNSREVIVDPWVDSPNFTTSTAVWEVETDGFDNVYVIGGETPMELRKYNGLGVWQWTYVTPWDTASVWLGTLATNSSGDSYITSGTTPEIERVNSSGSMVWHNGSSSGGLNTEYWTIAFNCDKTKLIVGGTGGNLLDFQANIYEMDTDNGDVLNIQEVHNGMSGGFMSTPIEVRSISSSKDSKYIFLTHNHVGAVMDNFGICPNDELLYKVPNGHDLGYKCENYLPATQNGGGLKALIANDQYIYTNAGDVVYKRLLTDGSLITSVALPGGNSSTIPIFGGLVVENSGMAVDECGNVYAGSGDRVVKFDADLNILDQVVVGFNVYDVSVNSNGEVLAVGAQQDNESINRNGRVASVALTACAQFALICCDANICPMDFVCEGDPAFNIAVSSPGGTFSGTGITDAVNGTFDPGLVGPGSYVITYTRFCGSETITIIVDPCEPISVCFDGVNIIATGGAGTIVWEDWGTYSYPITTEQECIDCPTTTPEYVPFVGIYIGCSDNDCTGTGWVEFATGNSVTPPSNWPMQVSDDLGVAFTYNNISEIPDCNACPTINVVTSQTNPTCFGYNNGQATATPSGGNDPYTYEWDDATGQTTTTASGLEAGTYNVIITDDDGCTQSAQVILTEPAEIVLSISGALSFCTGNSTTLDAGVGFSSYSWSPSGSSQTLVVTTGGNYSVTVSDGSGCTTSASVIVVENSSLTPVITGSLSFCTGSSTVLDAGSGYNSYSWSPSGSSQTITVSSVGSYSVTVTDSDGCTGSGTVSVTENPNPTPEITGSLTFCTGFSTTLYAGSGYTGYLWSSAASSENIVVSVAGDYSVTVTDSNGCTGVDIVSVIESSELSPNIIGDTVLCSGETIWLNGGAGYYSYSWSTTATSQLISISSGGTYSVTVADASGCSGTDVITIIENPSPIPNIIGIVEFCEGGSTILGLDDTYTTYEWSNGIYQPNIVINTGGSYSVTVTNSFGCSGVDNVLVTVFETPDASISGDLGICFGESTILSVAGGYSSYVWSTSETSTSISVSTGGNYSITIVDSNDCSETNSVTVVQSDEIDPEITGGIGFCVGDLTTLDAGFGYSSYLWSTGDTTQTIFIDDGGTFVVTVTDNIGCTGSVQLKIDALPRPYPEILGDLQICRTQQGKLYLAEQFSQYLWSTGSIDSLIFVDVEGFYFVSVINTEGCSGIDSVEFLFFDNVVFDSHLQNASCPETSDGIIYVEITGGSSPYIFSWNNGQADSVLNNVTPGDYYLTITDANGCESVSDFTLSSNNIGCLNIPNAFSPNDDDMNDTWEIEHIDMYDEVFIEIYNRWGQLIFSFSGTGFEYSQKSFQWDGTYNGKELPISSFIYILDLFNGNEPISGIVTIKK